MFRVGLYLASFLFFASSVQAADIDKVMVVVNDDVITYNEFNQNVAEVMADLRQRGSQMPPDPIVRRRVMDQMILEKIQLQAAELRGIQISDGEVDAALAELARSNNLDIASMREVMSRQGVDFDSIRENIEIQLTIQRLIETEVVRNVVVTDDEVDAFLLSSGTQVQDSEYNVSHILLPVAEDADDTARAVLEERARAIREEIVNGLDFVEAAKSYSRAGDASQGGNLGWRTTDQLPSLFMNALATLEPGQVTRVVRSDNGFHILKLNDVRGRGGEEVTQTRARHILIRTDDFTTRQEAANRLTQIRVRIVNGADFAELALAHSDDTVSSVQGGDLGWLSPGDTVRPFEDAMDALEIGEVSQPLASPFGVHLIEVLERRRAQPAEMSRANARRQLRAIKTEEKIQEWIDEIRDSAYVEVL